MGVLVGPAVPVGLAVAVGVDVRLVDVAAGRVAVAVGVGVAGVAPGTGMMSTWPAWIGLSVEMPLAWARATRPAAAPSTRPSITSFPAPSSRAASLARPLLADGGLVYAEAEAPIVPADAAAHGLEIVRAARAGRVCFHLLQPRNA